MGEYTMITNNVPRDVIDAYELTATERADFDYLNWEAIDAGSASASFFRYKGAIYDIGEFQTTYRMPEFSPLRNWDGYISDSFFSGVVVRYVEQCERVVVGRFYA